MIFFPENHPNVTCYLIYKVRRKEEGEKVRKVGVGESQTITG